MSGHEREGFGGGYAHEFAVLVCQLRIRVSSAYNPGVGCDFTVKRGTRVLNPNDYILVWLMTKAINQTDLALAQT